MCLQPGTTPSLDYLEVRICCQQPSHWASKRHSALFAADLCHFYLFLFPPKSTLISIYYMLLMKIFAICTLSSCTRTAWKYQKEICLATESSNAVNFHEIQTYSFFPGMFKQLLHYQSHDDGVFKSSCSIIVKCFIASWCSRKIDFIVI